jgi:hypothetical protein
LERKDRKKPENSGIKWNFPVSEKKWKNRKKGRKGRRLFPIERL